MILHPLWWGEFWERREREQNEEEQRLQKEEEEFEMGLKQR